MRQLEEMSHCPETGIVLQSYRRCWHCVWSVKLGMTWLCVYENANGESKEVGAWASHDAGYASAR